VGSRGRGRGRRQELGGTAEVADGIPGRAAEVAGRSSGRGGGRRRERGDAAAEDQEAIAAEESIEVGKNQSGCVCLVE
jgi:hypothetical protein